MSRSRRLSSGRSAKAHGGLSLGPDATTTTTSTTTTTTAATSTSGTSSTTTAPPHTTTSTTTGSAPPTSEHTADSPTTTSDPGQVDRSNSTTSTTSTLTPGGPPTTLPTVDTTVPTTARVPDTSSSGRGGEPITDLDPGLGTGRLARPSLEAQTGLGVEFLLLVEDMTLDLVLSAILGVTLAWVSLKRLDGKDG